nr:MAG TPA: hypothetical protein [Caudoviricetes sp.]
MQAPKFKNNFRFYTPTEYPPGCFLFIPAERAIPSSGKR